MTPKEKAYALVFSMTLERDIPYDYAKDCALIAVDEILLIDKLQDIESQNYWEKVIEEIYKI